MQPPLRFGHYEVVQDEESKPVELGRGAMGITYKAFDPSLHREAAIKVINNDRVGTGASRERFLREARAAARLIHSNIATVFQFGEEAGVCYYAMELVAGESVESLIKRLGRLASGQALDIGRQVALAIAAAHAAGIVHRDIKPSNLMLAANPGREPMVKVIDFGLARQTDARSDGDQALPTKCFVGTIHYASPEQIESLEVDVRSDLYSLGATLWQLLTGETLFHGSTARVAYHQVHVPPPLERLNAPGEIIDLFKRLLAKNPRERPQTPGELLSLIERVQSRVPPDLLCDLRGDGAGGSVCVSLHEVLRVRGALPLDEVLPILDRIGETVDGRWADEGATFDFRLNAIRAEFGPDCGQTAGELTRGSVRGWPPFSILVGRTLAEDFVTVAPDDEQTRLASESFLVSRNCVPALARVAYALLGGASNKLASGADDFPPLASLTENGNLILQRALGDKMAKAYPNVHEFCTVLGDGSCEKNMRAEGRVDTSTNCAETITGPEGGFEGKRPESVVKKGGRGRRSWWVAAACGLLGLALAGAVGIMRGPGRKPEAAAPEPTPTPVPGQVRAADLAAANAAAPFVNHLGMGFLVVPVPGSSDGATILFACTETTTSQYASFLESSGRRSDAPGFAQAGDHPAVNVSWEDATAFCRWLTQTELTLGRLPRGVRYRLPTDHEWSCAVGIGGKEDPSKSPREKRGGVPGVYPWGNSWPPPPRSGNYADAIAKQGGAVQVSLDDYEDGFSQTCPVNAFPPNGLGLYGLGGNAAEWCEDRYDPARSEARTLRGACWRDCEELYLRASFRAGPDPQERFAGYGFRCVIEVPSVD